MGRRAIELSRQDEIDFLLLQKLANRANARLRMIEKNYGKDQWGARKLKRELDVTPLGAWTKSGRAKISKSQTRIQRRAEIKILKDFLSPSRCFNEKRY